MKTPYETMFLLPPTMSEEQIDAFVGRLQDLVEKKHGEVTSLDKMGVRKTAYAVNKMKSAYYILLQYRGTGETIHEVERMLKNSDEVMKYLSTKITSKPAVTQTAKLQPDASPEEAVTEETKKEDSTQATITTSPASEAQTSLAGNGAQE